LWQMAKISIPVPFTHLELYVRRHCLLRHVFPESKREVFYFSKLRRLVMFLQGSRLSLLVFAVLVTNLDAAEPPSEQLP